VWFSSKREVIGGLGGKKKREKKERKKDGRKEKGIKMEGRGER
jgi:hypothetical protein